MTISLALRSLKRTPVFAGAMLLSLILGIGSIGSMFSVVNSVLLAPLPYGAPDRLVSVGLNSGPQGHQLSPTSSSASLQASVIAPIKQPSALYFHYKQLARCLTDIGFYRTGNANLWNDGDQSAAERVTATWITASMLPLLQIPPLLGRSFTPDEERMGGTDAVILSEALWRTRFNAAPDIIGKTLLVNSVPRQIVGVMPARFAFPTPDTRVWLPIRPKSTITAGDFAYSGVARLAPGATAELAQQELSTLISGFPEAFPQLDSGGSTATWLAEIRPNAVVLLLRQQFTGSIAPLLWMLTAASGLVLLVAWANVVNLMLIRSEGSQLELSIRAALGASPWRTASHFLGESMVLGAVSGVFALLVAYGAIRALVAFGPTDVPRIAELGVGVVGICFIALVTAVGVIICTAVPALQIRRTNFAIKLSDGARGQSAGKSRQRLGASITIVQIALALLVLIGSALLLRTAQKLFEVQPGFDANGVTIIWTQLPFAGYDDSASVAFYAHLTDKVRQLPGVRVAGLTMRAPLLPGEAMEQTFAINGEMRSLPVNVVDAGYFSALRIPIRAGRNFQRLELERGGDIMISQRAAAMLFNDPSGMAAVGKRLALAANGLNYTVIGVVGDVRDQNLANAPVAMIYRAQAVPISPKLEPSARRTMALVVRSNSGYDTLVPSIRKLVRELDATVPIFNVQTMPEVVRNSTARLSLALMLMTAAAGITLVLGAIGLYGVMAYLVALRTREFGIRIALGANPRRIAAGAALQGFVLTVIGAAIGFTLYALTAPYLKTFLYGVTASDPVTLIGAALVLMATASLASVIPARRAAQIDPAEALRTE